MTPRAKNPDPTRQPRAWMRLARDIIRFAAEQGANRQALLQLIDTTPQQLNDADRRLPLTNLYALFEHAAAVTNPSHFGMHYARAFHINNFDALGFLMMTSATVGEAFRRAMRYQRVWSDGEHYDMHEEQGRVRIRYRPHGPPREAHRFLAELAFVDLSINVGTLCGKPMPLQQVRFRHGGPIDADEYARLFECPVTLHAPINEITFAAAALDWPLPDANAAMCAFFERYSQQELSQLPAGDSLAERLRELIAARLCEQLPDLHGFAKQLHMSSRTLQRRLHDEGHTLHGLIDDVRRERAAIFLGQPMAIAEVSYLLGYSEPSAFHRAFKRWTGATPDAYRAAQS